MTTKTCPKCREIKLLSDFRSVPSRYDGVDSYCLLCKSAYDEEYRQKNRVELRVKNRKWARENRLSWPVNKRPTNKVNFVRAVLTRDKRCVITGMPADVIIVDKTYSRGVVEAAHIKPRKLCLDGEYIDINNGLSLRGDIHKAFDLGLFTIDDDGSIISSRWVADDFYPPKILTSLTSGQRKYLKGHRGWTLDNWSLWAF